MRIGELARRSGLTRDTIRFYEREGLIASEPSADPSNDYRNYPEELVERLQMITEARAVGLSVADLAQLLRAMEGFGDAGFDADAFLDDKIAEVTALIAQSRRLLDTLRQTRAALRAPA